MALKLSASSVTWIIFYVTLLHFLLKFYTLLPVLKNFCFLTQSYSVLRFSIIIMIVVFVVVIIIIHIRQLLQFGACRTLHNIYHL